MSQASLAMSASAQSSASSSEQAIDEAIAVLREHATEFARLPVRDKAELLRACLDRIADAAPVWVSEGCRAKGLPPEMAGEEWLAGPLATVRIGRMIAESLDEIAVRGRPSLGRGGHMGEDGRYRIDLFPASTFDQLLFAGITGHVLMEPGVDRNAARRKQATFYQKKDPDGAVSLVLGAGNVSSIPPTDAFTKLFEEGSVVLLKMNPVNEWVGPILERTLEPLIARGYLRVVYGGVDEGKYVCGHDGIDDIHITGSNVTHDHIVWGPPGPERERRIAENRPVLHKPISSELGNVSPVAIVPYRYTDAQLDFQAENVVTMIANNGSFNCNAAKLLITSRKWPQRDLFFRILTDKLQRTPTRVAYYPGAFDRYQRLVGGRDNVQKFGHADDRKLPWTLIREVDADNVDEPLFHNEPFCSILSETCVGGTDPVDFLTKAVGFMNDTLWGTLNATIIIHPTLEDDPTVSKVLRRAIKDLRYGTVAINLWPAVCYGAGSLPWGGHQSASLKDIQSGIGWVHNSFMLGGIDKAVIRGPIKITPKPVWYYSNPKSLRVGPAMVKMERQPSWGKLPGILWRALL